jgi:multidrug transporter EmrE-like cation transporter
LRVALGLAAALCWGAGVLFFHERSSPAQWAGLGLVVGGLVLLGPASG